MHQRRGIVTGLLLSQLIRLYSIITEICDISLLQKTTVTDDSLSAVCEKMLHRCLAPEAGRDRCDNITVIVVQLKKPTQSAATTSSAEQCASTTKELWPIEPNDLKSMSTP
ncbi:hypothetical protein QYE76_016906 [Lolium multiflorum]|uniref:protein-serine/threonine phosphatase n=1 Tax=Lolium multiflorum TaxID=4521 RepID=A0AAD8VBL7_LOLMU|nr:hypothetical protein QYE76_016906 [Lolium multiflorum]